MVEGDKFRAACEEHPSRSASARRMSPITTRRNQDLSG
jgi:hypothetical protein